MFIIMVVPDQESTFVFQDLLVLKDKLAFYFFFNFCFVGIIIDSQLIFLLLYQSLKIRFVHHHVLQLLPLDLSNF